MARGPRGRGFNRALCASTALGWKTLFPHRNMQGLPAYRAAPTFFARVPAHFVGPPRRRYLPIHLSISFDAMLLIYLSICRASAFPWPDVCPVPWPQISLDPPLEAPQILQLLGLAGLLLTFQRSQGTPGPLSSQGKRHPPLQLNELIGGRHAPGSFFL